VGADQAVDRGGVRLALSNFAGKAREGLDSIRKRFPHRSEIITILGIAVFICHSWSLLGFFNRLSSFILYLSLGEVAGIFAFMMAFAFLESLLVTSVLVTLSAILPYKWLSDGFAYKGFVVMVMATVAAIILQRTMQGELPSLPILTLIWFTPLVWIAVFIKWVQKQPRIQNVLINIADRISIMLFLYVPIGITSLIVVALGNLL
jgi:hypothetical protein